MIDRRRFSTLLAGSALTLSSGRAQSRPAARNVVCMGCSLMDPAGPR